MISRDKASGRGLGENAKHFDFDLTCDVIGDPEVNKKKCSTVLPGLSDTVCGFKIGQVLSEIKGDFGVIEIAEGADPTPPPRLPSRSRVQKSPRRCRANEGIVSGF